MIIDRYPKLSAALMMVLSVTLAVSITQLLGLLGLDARAPAYAPIAHPVTARVTTYSDATVVDTVLGPLDGGFRTGDLATLARGSTGLSASTVFATGAMTAGDGAGGTFIWASTAPAGGDDGCTVIVPVDSSGNPSTGAWVRQWSGPIDVRWCGACPTCDPTVNADAINAAYALAAYRSTIGLSATVYISGAFLISKTILVGLPSGGLSSINTIGDGPLASRIGWSPAGLALDAGFAADAGPDGLPVAPDIAVLLWNQYGSAIKGINVSYSNGAGAPPGASVGIALSGPVESQTTNQVHLDTVSVNGFGTDVSLGGVNTAVGLADCAAQVLFSNCYLSGATVAGIYGGGNGNSLEITFLNGGLSGNYVGAQLGTAGGWLFAGGGCGGNTYACFLFSAEWQGPFTVRDWRFELGAGETALVGTTAAEIDSCTFQMTAPPTGLNIPIQMAGYTNSKVSVRNSQFANNYGSDFPQIVSPSGTAGNVSTIEMVNDRVYNSSSAPFYLVPAGGSNGLRYYLYGNYLDGGNQGLHIGTIVDGGMVDSVSSP